SRTGPRPCRPHQRSSALQPHLAALSLTLRCPAGPNRAEAVAPADSEASRQPQGRMGTSQDCGPNWDQCLERETESQPTAILKAQARPPFRLLLRGTVGPACKVPFNFPSEVVVPVDPS